MAVPLRGGGKGHSIKEKITFFSDGEVPMTITLEGGGLRTKKFALKRIVLVLKLGELDRIQEVSPALALVPVSISKIQTKFREKKQTKNWTNHPYTVRILEKETLRSIKNLHSKVKMESPFSIFFKSSNKNTSKKYLFKAGGIFLLLP